MPLTKKISKDLWLALGVAILLILAGFFLGWANNHVVREARFPGFHYIVEPHNPLKFMANWDAVDYLSIARHGYTSLFWVGWFPLYPLAIHALDYVVPSPLISGFLISWVSLVGAIYFYLKIVRRLFEVDEVYEPLRALIFFILFPTAVFLIAPFTESLYAFLALGSIYFALQRRWLWSAVLALFCTATHVTGVLVVILVALILLEEKVGLSKIILTVIVGSLGLASFMFYLLISYHKPLAFLEAQTTYHDWDKNGFSHLITTATLSNLIFIVLILVATVYWWKRRKSFAVYSLMFLAIPVFGHQFGGFDRYVLMAFPVQLMLYGYLRHKQYLYPYATALLGAAWVYFLLQYAGGYIGS